DRRAFAKLKRYVMDHRLAPQGFVKAVDGSYFKRQGGGVVGLQLQTSQYADEFFVNLVWTPDGAPSFLSGTVKPSEEMGVLDYAMLGRLEDVSHQGGLPHAWHFGIDVDDSADVIEQALRHAVSTCGSVSEHMSDRRQIL